MRTGTLRPVILIKLWKINQMPRKFLHRWRLKYR
nr:MAG TPA: hypothetical protein [Caudoviricetes sp.]